MRQPGSDRLSLVVGVGFSRRWERYAKVGGRVDGVVGADLSAPEGREGNIEEVGQGGVLIVSVTATVGCSEAPEMWMLLVGMSWRAVSVLSVSAFSLALQVSSSSPSQSSLLILLMQLHLRIQDS